MPETTQTMPKENGSTLHKNFHELRQIPPFNVTDEKTSIFAARKWLANGTLRSKALGFGLQILQLLNIKLPPGTKPLIDIKSLPEIQNLIKDDQKKEEISERAHILIGNAYGIPGESKEKIAPVIANYAGRANYVIDDYINAKFKSFNQPNFELMNEVKTTSDPVDLLLMMLDESYTTRVRFEAKRKLVLMSLAASIDRKEKEAKIEEKMKIFEKFLNDRVLDKDVKKGELEEVWILSKHNPIDFACESYTILNKGDKEAFLKNANTEDLQLKKLTKLEMRKFTLNGKEILVQYSTRKKHRESSILKLLRKGSENPDAAVEDDLGIKAVFKSKEDIDEFQERLSQGAVATEDPKDASYMTFEEIEDSLNGEDFSAENVGSSKKTKQRKFFIKFGMKIGEKMEGLRIEALTQDIKAYLGSEYENSVSHNEYEINRLFDTGVIELLFPNSIYNTNWTEVKPKIIQTIRERIKSTLQ